jgi:hypothetical protein
LSPNEPSGEEKRPHIQNRTPGSGVKGVKRMAIDVPPALTGLTTMGVLSRKHIVELRQAAPNDRGNRLDVAIRLSGLRQGHIARALNVPQSVISNVKLGRRNKVTVEFANR